MYSREQPNKGLQVTALRTAPEAQGVRQITEMSQRANAGVVEIGNRSSESWPNDMFPLTPANHGQSKLMALLSEAHLEADRGGVE